MITLKIFHRELKLKISTFVSPMNRSPSIPNGGRKKMIIVVFYFLLSIVVSFVFVSSRCLFFSENVQRKSSDVFLGQIYPNLYL